MNITEEITKKLDDLTETERKEVDDFINLLIGKSRGNSAQNTNTETLAESGMDNYLTDLEAYEEKLAAGEIKW